MFTTRLYRFVVLIVVGVLCLSSIWQTTQSTSVSAATPAVRKLTIDQTDTTAHAVGGSWHDANNTPYVVDFGTPDPNAPVAGMDQWLTAQGQPVEPRGNVTGTKKYLVLRVYFDGESADSYYAKDAADEDSDSPWNVHDDLMKPLQDLYKLTSYNKVTIDWDISNLYRLPNNRNYYIDTSTGNSSGACVETGADGKCRLSQFGALIEHSTELAKNDFNYNDYAGILVLMSDIGSSAAFHRAAAGVCNTKYYGYDLPGVASNQNYGCIVALENHAASSDSSNEKNRIRQELYGRLGHEFGHAFQQAGPAHPSNYDNPFELMDSNYPGHVGAYEKQANVAFPGWLPPSQYIQVSKTAKTQNDSTCLRAIEYDPALNPVPQALKVSITGSLYYMLSVRVKNDGTTGNGDHLNAHFTSGGNPSGIPSEGMLIERVNEGASGEDGDPIVTVKGKGGDIDDLWQKGDTADFFSTDGVKFSILPQAVNNPDKMTMCVRISFDATNSLQPDVSMRPWRELPGETWETTDIWFDSPLNGYGTYRYGSWNDINNVPAPRYNGDIPASGSVNRVYARIRNVGSKVATNITVRFQVTDPAGMGINNSTSWIGLGDGVNAGTSDGVINSTRFPALASLAPGAYTDVYVEWKPEFTDAPTTGTFDYHTCVRVKIDPVAGETVTGNQDGNDEQENIFTFEATPAVSPVYQHQFTIFNESVTNPITYYLKLDGTLPTNWDISINKGNQIVTLDPNEQLRIPVVITPTGSAVVGSIFEARIAAEKRFDLTNDLALAIDPNDPEARHAGMLDVGGVSFAVNVLAPTEIRCEAYARGSFVDVVGSLDGFEGIHQAGTALRAYAQAYDINGAAIPLDDRATADIGSNGVFRMRFSARGEQSPTVGGSIMPKSVRCVFPGTHMLASSSTGLVNLQNIVPPTPTTVPWWGSEFHSTLNLNQFITPPLSYSDTVNGVTGTKYICPPNNCPIPTGGRRGRGVHFFDNSRILHNGLSTIPLGPSFSVGLWAKREHSNVDETLLAHGTTLATGKMFNMGFVSDGRFVCSTYNDELYSVATYNDTSWHHFVCIVDGPTRTMYVDNVEVASSTTALPPYNTNNAFMLARRFDRPNGFRGVLDEVKIYNSAIGDTTVTDLYNNDPMALTPSYGLSFDDIAIVESEGVTTPILASCGGNICPVVYYPDRSVTPRMLERVAAQRLEPQRWITWSSTKPVAAGTMGTLMFWAHLDDTSDVMLPVVLHSVANRPQIYWRGSTHELTFNSLTYDWTDDYTSGWHMFSFVMRPGGVLQIYIDGDKVAEGLAAPGSAPFRVGAGLNLRVGGLDGGELAAVELANWAYPANYIAQRYAGNMNPSNVTPTKTLTVTPTATNTTQPVVTIPVINLNKTMTAMAAAQNAAKTAEAAPFATATKKAQLLIPTFAMMQTQWSLIDRTETAYAIKTPIPTKRPVLPILPTSVPTLTYYIFPTRNLLHTSTRTMTPSMTATTVPTFTPSATIMASATNTQVVATRTKINTPTFQATVTPSKTPLLTATQTANPQQTATMTRTRTQTATASRTATPGRFGYGMLPITQLPKGMLFRAVQHIYDSRSLVAPNWNTAFIGETAIPFYRPDICGGATPAYYELSVYKDATLKIPAGFLMMTAPCDNDVPHDVPISHWNSSGVAISSQIQFNPPPGVSPIKLWKLDTLSYVADQNGVIIGKLGQLPALINGLTSSEYSQYSSARTDIKWSPAIVSTGDDNFVAGRIPTPVISGLSPSTARTLWQYADFNITNDFAGYLRQYPVAFAPLIAGMKQRVSSMWVYENEITDADTRLCTGCTQLHLPVVAGGVSRFVIPIKGITAQNITNMTPNVSTSTLSFVVESSTYAGYPVIAVAAGTLTNDALPRMTLKINPSSSLFTLLPPTYVTFYMVQSPPSLIRADRSWSSWNYYWAGNESDQRKYAQWNVSGSCAVGCGPVAWMMLLGWVDIKSTYPQVSGQFWKRWNAYRENGSSSGLATSGAGIAPQSTTIGSTIYMAPGVFTSTEYIRNQVGTFCFSGSGATYPWSMDNVRNYLTYVGTGISIDTHYNAVGYHEDSLRDYTIEHLTKANVSERRPVIIGTGWLNHYPLAWGYAWRSRPTTWRDAGWWVGDDVLYARYFYVNNGHGGSDDGWVDASTWFAGRVSP